MPDTEDMDALAAFSRYIVGLFESEPIVPPLADDPTVPLIRRDNKTLGRKVNGTFFERFDYDESNYDLDSIIKHICINLYLQTVTDSVCKIYGVYRIGQYTIEVHRECLEAIPNLHFTADVLQRVCIILDRLQDEVAFVHGDLGPANIMRRANGDVVLIDFEYSRITVNGVNYCGGHLIGPDDDLPYFRGNDLFLLTLLLGRSDPKLAHFLRLSDNAFPDLPVGFFRRLPYDINMYWLIYSLDLDFMGPEYYALLNG